MPKSKPKGELNSTARFLVDTLRPRRRHSVIEGYAPRRTNPWAILGLIAVCAAAVALAYFVG